jgi:hypothetical protein
MKKEHNNKWYLISEKKCFANCFSYFTITTASFLLFTVIFSGCKKFVDVDAPVTNTNAENAYATDAVAAGVLTGIYTKMSQDDSQLAFGGGLCGVTLFSGLSSDELILYAGITDGDPLFYYKNSLKSNINAGTYFWTYIYPKIYTINSAIQGISKSNTLTPAVKNQLLGEAYFLRAFCYFYLTNLYGDVPFVESTDFNVTFKEPRLQKDQIYQKIIEDLNTAKSLLRDKYIKGDAFTSYNTGSEERVRPNKATATAMLARTYLYINDWTKAEAAATEIIDNKITYDTVPLNNVFIKNSKETIWALQPVDVAPNANTGEGRLFILPSSGPEFDYPVYLNDNLIQSFEVGDQRLVNWVASMQVDNTTYNYPFKYKIGSSSIGTNEYVMVLRLGEQYLIRAEARAQLGNIVGSSDDLNIIRQRAGLANITANSQNALLNAIAHERQVELFAEWGHRWLDLKRTNNIDAVMSVVTPQKGGTWDSRWALYPIPLSEIQRGPNLTQNPGY